MSRSPPRSPTAQVFSIPTAPPRGRRTWARWRRSGPGAWGRRNPGRAPGTRRARARSRGRRSAPAPRAAHEAVAQPGLVGPPAGGLEELAGNGAGDQRGTELVLDVAGDPEGPLDLRGQPAAHRDAAHVGDVPALDGGVVEQHRHVRSDDVERGAHGRGGREATAGDRPVEVARRGRGPTRDGEPHEELLVEPPDPRAPLVPGPAHAHLDLGGQVHLAHPRAQEGGHLPEDPGEEAGRLAHPLELPGRFHAP